MNTFTLLLNTATNAFALPAVYACWMKKDYLGLTIISSSFVASCLMHITEKKHGLKPFLWADYSNTFLNLDRGLAFLVFFYGLYKARCIPLTELMPIVGKALLGTLASLLGELTENLYLYNALHTVWHYAAFSSLHNVISYH